MLKKYLFVTVFTVGHKTQIDYPNNTSMLYGYGTAYWLTKADGVLNTTGDMLVKNEIAQRDGVGNITQKNVTTGQLGYGYDNIYQLTSYNNSKAPVNKSMTYNYG